MTKERQNRLPRTKRAKKAPHFEWMERDFRLLRAVVDYRFLLLPQFEKLFPGTSIRGIARRLMLLYHGGYVERISVPRLRSSPLIIYAMSEKGAEALAGHEGVERSEIPWQRHLNRVGHSHVQHLLAINDLMIAFKRELKAAQEAGQVKDFAVLRGDKGEHRLKTEIKDKKGYRQTVSVIPDVVLPIMFGSGEYGVFFVEVDRATMRGRQWGDKVTVYRGAIRQPEVKQKYKTGWFIVLTVTTGEKRVMSLAQKTLAAGGKRAFWFTTMARLEVEGVFGSIWLRATDVLESGPDLRRRSIFEAVGS